MRFKTWKVNGTGSKAKMRPLGHKFENQHIRDEIENVSNSKYMVYHLQLEKLIKMIKELMKNQVTFITTQENNFTIIEDTLDKNGILMIVELTN